MHYFGTIEAAGNKVLKQSSLILKYKGTHLLSLIDKGYLCVRFCYFNAPWLSF